MDESGADTQSSRLPAILAAFLLAALTLGSESPPTIIEGHARELADVRSVFVMTKDEPCRDLFCSVISREIPDLRVVDRIEDSDAILVLTSRIELETIAVPTQGCRPCQARDSATPRELQVEATSVVLSVLVPAGENTFRRIHFSRATGGFGTNPDERLADQFVKVYRKWTTHRSAEP